MALDLIVPNADVRGIHPSEMRSDGPGSTPMFNDVGSINASSVRELVQQQLKFMSALNSGAVMASYRREELSSEIKAAARKEQLTELRAAYHDRGNPASWIQAGQEIAEKVRQTTDRLGFMRRIIARFPVEQGQDARFDFQSKIVVATDSTGPNETYPQMVRDSRFIFNFFYITAHLLIGENEIAGSRGDIIQEYQDQAFEAIGVNEDRWLLGMADALVGFEYPQFDLAGGLTPQNLAFMIQEMANRRIPPAVMIMTQQFYSDYIASPGFQANFSEVHKYQAMETGQLANLYGIPILTDSNRVPNQQVLPDNTMYIFTKPEFLGGYTDRGPIQVYDLSPANNTKPARGHYMFEQLAGGLVNPAGVIRAVRT